MSAWAKVLAVLFVLPVGALGFFYYAPHLENQKVQEQFLKSIAADPQYTEGKKAEYSELVRSFHLETSCFDPSAEARQLIEKLQVADVCGVMEQFQWARRGSIALIALALLHLAIVGLLSIRARGSNAALLSSLRAAWASSTFFSLIILTGQTALAAFTFFYLTVLFTDSYFPKLIGALVIGGIYAFYQVAKLIFARINIEPEEPTSQAVSESDAPKLWSKVRDIASQLETAPPDNILLGMSDRFFVTEFPVKHAGGTSTGRTLHLSAPMMQQMPVEEVVAIIGHELGHFKGEDTMMTRMMTPSLTKADRTLDHLAEAGWVGRPALYAMNVFSYLFEKAIGTYRRERELHADAFGARVTHPETIASALVRYSYQSEAYAAAMHQHITQNAALEASLVNFQDVLKRDDKFWEQMDAHALPHPFDSHPPMKVRLEKLGFKIDDLRFKAVKPAESSAFDVLMKGKTEVIRSAMDEHNSRVQIAKDRMAFKEAPADKLDATIIAKHFPQVVLQVRTTRVYLLSLLILILMVGIPSAVLATVFDSVALQVAMVATILVGFYLCFVYWRDWHKQTLTLNHIGIQLATWREMLKFEDVKELRHLVQNGSEQVTFVFKAKRPPLPRKPIFPWNRKDVSIDLLAFQGKQRDNVIRIFRYYTREIEP